MAVRGIDLAPGFGSGTGPDLTDITNRISSLEDTYVKSTRFATISAGASGTITIPQGATIVLDDFGGGIDAVISKITEGKPEITEVYDTSYEMVVTTFNAAGEYALSGTPLAYPVAIIYVVKQKFINYKANDSDIVGQPEFVSIQDISHALRETGRSGFVEWIGSGLLWSWTALTNTFTLLKGGEGYVLYREVYFPANQTLVIANGEVAYLYIDQNGVLQKGATSTKADNKERIQIGRFQVDVDGNIIFIRKNHSFGIDGGALGWIERGFGSAIEGIAGAATIVRYTTGTGLVTTDRMVNISSGMVVDGDLETPWNAIVLGMYVNHTYRSGSVFKRQSFSQQFPMLYNAAGTPTAITSGSRGVFRLFVTVDSLNSAEPQFISEMHTAQFQTLGNAQSAIGNGSISNFGGLDKDVAQVGYVVVRNNASGGYVEYVQPQLTTFRQLVGGGGVASTADNVLTDVTNFNGAIGATETTVQAALEKLDDVVGANRVVSTTSTMLATDSLILADVTAGNITLTVPLGSTVPVGKTIRIMNHIQNANSCYVYPQTGYTIDGFGRTTDNAIRLPFKASVTLVYVGSDSWKILLTENWTMRVVTANTSNAFAGDALVRLMPGANQTFYIYASVTAGKRVVIYRDKFNGTTFTCTVQDGNNYYINNAPSLKLAPGECVTLISGSSEWFVESTTTTLMMQVAPAKGTPIDADKFMLQDTAANNALSVITYAQMKAALKTYFDTLYTPL